MRTSEKVYGMYRKRSFLEQYLNAGYAPKYPVTAFSEVGIAPVRHPRACLRWEVCFGHRGKLGGPPYRTDASIGAFDLMQPRFERLRSYPERRAIRAREYEDRAEYQSDAPHQNRDSQHV